VKRYSGNNLGAIISRAARREIAAEEEGNLGLDADNPQLRGRGTMPGSGGSLSV